jgi:hypothetical protein
MSLLGVFVTVSGIVFGADTATKPRGSSDFEVSSDAKFTACGARAYAGLTGSSSVIIESPTSTTQHFALDAVREACKEELTRQPDLPVRALTELIGKAIVRYVESTYPKEFRSTLETSDGMTLIVAGFDGAQPVIAGLNVKIREPLATAPRVGTSCSAYSGEVGPASALRRRLGPIPRLLSDRPEVNAVRSCIASKPLLTPDQARAYFRLAVDASLDYASDFKLERGVIDWPIDFGFVTSSGVSPIVREVKPPQ